MEQKLQEKAYFERKEVYKSHENLYIGEIRAFFIHLQLKFNNLFLNFCDLKEILLDEINVNGEIVTSIDFLL